ncbi:MAG TPA: hypothetical protein VFS21_22345 [Roseiflexaceae bacterium]|nr:hypothetical protein [Roseiflexaceae bacterium]
MTALLPVLWICGCALALCWYAGWGAARLALPVLLRPFAAPLAPLVGYALAMWVGYTGVSTALNLRWSLALLLALATALNLLAWRRTGPPRLAWPDRVGWGMAALLALALLAGVWPLLRYGYLSAIGQGWDPESYWPMAQHLLDLPVARIPEAPQNPLRELVTSPPGIGLTLGFSVLQGFTMLLSGQSAIATFAPLLASMRALGLLAVFVWLRATMGLRPAPALLATALAGAGALLLWIGFFNFGMQMSAWPLLGLGMAVGLAAVEDLAARGRAAWPAALLGAVVLAALPVAYYPALTIWAPMAVALGAVRLLEMALAQPGLPLAQRLRPAGGLTLAAGGLAVLTLLLAAPAVADYYEGFSFRYSLPEPKIGPDRFIAATDTLGLTAFRLPGGGEQPPAALVLLASLLAAGFALAAFLLPADDQTPQAETAELAQNSKLKTQNSKLRWLGVCAAVLAYLLWLRFGRPYEYAFMKGSAYAGFVGWGLVALGLQAVARWVGRRRGALPALAALALVPLATAVWAQLLIVREHSKGPAIFTRDLVALEEAARLVPPGATVLISNDEPLIGPNSGLLATIFYGREIWGHVATAYSGLDAWPEGQLPQYALLTARERPWPLELGGRELWRSRGAALYSLEDVPQALLGRERIYGGGGPADRKKPAALALWRRAGPNRAAEPGAPLRLYVGNTLAFSPERAPGGGPARRLGLTVASLQPQRVTVEIDGAAQRFEVEAGVSTLAVPLTAPTTVAILPEATLALLHATEAEQDAAVAPDPALVVWQPLVEQQGDTLRVRVETANPGRHALRVGLTVVEDSFFEAQQPARLLADLPVDGGWEVALDLARGATEARAGGQPVPLLDVATAPNPPDSGYFGVLTLYAGEEPVASAPLFTFRVASGRVTEFSAEPYTLEASPAGLGRTPLPGNLRALEGTGRTLDDQTLALEGALLVRQPTAPGAPADAPFAPGDTLGVRLFWHAPQPPGQPLMVSLQLIGADNRKWAQWDGPVGGEWRPLQVWRAGDRLRQDVPLALDPATLPGSYRLQLVVYDPASGQPRGFGGEQTLGLGTLDVR